MSHLIAALLGFVEGVTEYLPVSSTGHLILVGHFLGSDGEGSKSFDIVIQLGAILAVLIHYRALLTERLKGLFAGRREATNLFGALMLAFVPTAIAGLAFRRVIRERLFGPIPVAIALVVGGVFMIIVERIRARRNVAGETGLDHVTPGRALAIGIGQCFSLWPGASRSMCTIVAGQLTGLSTATAAEFSFLLALPTLGAATLYELYKGRHDIFAVVGVSQLAVGMVVSFLVAWAVVASFLHYLRRRGLEPFGYYRIAMGLAVFWFLR
ncbi:MAG TPA: undecaprenyl-diphosphate phosphatase [Polyangiaceae bacterium]|nr:undecaprenyl-diphosphate phosphatase [Polyangiaceae bacterium]